MQRGLTALDYARQHGQTEIMQLLTERGTTTPVEAKVRVKMTCVCVCVCVCASTGHGSGVRQLFQRVMVTQSMKDFFDPGKIIDHYIHSSRHPYT